MCSKISVFILHCQYYTVLKVLWDIQLWTNCLKKCPEHHQLIHFGQLETHKILMCWEKQKQLWFPMEQIDKGPRQRWQREAEPAAARSPLDIVYHQRAHLRILIKHQINAAPPQKNKEPPTSSGKSRTLVPLCSDNCWKRPSGRLTAMGWCEKMRIPACVCVCVSDDEPPLGTKSLICYPRFHICLVGD